MPVRLPLGRARLLTRPSWTGSLPTVKTIGMVEVAFFAAVAEGRSKSGDQVDLAADEVEANERQPIIAALRPTILDPRILSLNVAGFLQPLAECSRLKCDQVGGTKMKESRSPASPAAARAPRAATRRRAAEQADEVAPPHSITSSATASSIGGMVRPSALAVFRLIARVNLVGC